MRITTAIRKNPKSHPTVRAPGKIDTFPAPTRGWNARDPLGGMKPGDAVVLDNYMPTTADVRLRGGSLPWATGMGVGKVVETLMEYSSGTTDKLFAAADHKIFDVTAQAAVGAPVVAAGITNNRWQYTIFQTSAAINRLVLVNGVDKMLQYDGAVWAAIDGASAPIAITGVATTALVNVWDYEKRLFFIEVNSMNAWYLPVDSYGGAAVKLPLGGVFKKGGHLVAGGTWTRDGGNGMDDLCVFLTSHGEVAIYQGTDPAVAANWTLIGRYEVGAPIGTRCLVKTGADLALINLDGIVGLSKILSLDRAASNKVALSDRIKGAFDEATRLYKNNFGWEAIAYPAGTQVWFNIPVAEGVTQYQFVLNTTTGAWCRFLGLNANTWCLHNERMYFGNNNGQVWIADEGEADNNVEIAGLIKTAFVYHGGSAVQKDYKMAKPILYSDISLKFGLSLVVDFDESVLAPSVSSGASSSMSFWDTSTWDVDPWATIVALRNWKTVNGVGTCASIIFKTNTKGFPVRLNSIDILYEPGGIL